MISASVNSDERQQTFSIGGLVDGFCRVAFGGNWRGSGFSSAFPWGGCLDLAASVSG